MKPRGFVERFYDPKHWEHHPKWALHVGIDGEWYDFESLRIIEGLAPEMLYIPLPGHTRGHCGVAIKTEDGWLLQCGDAASSLYQLADVYDRDPSSYQVRVFPGWFARRIIGQHVAHLRKLVQEHGDEVRVINSHDIYSFLDFHTAETEAQE